MKRYFINRKEVDKLEFDTSLNDDVVDVALTDEAFEMTVEDRNKAIDTEYAKRKSDLELNLATTINKNEYTIEEEL